MVGQDQGRREQVQDPLAITGREQLPDRSLALQGVRAPNVGDPTGGFAKEANGLSAAMGGLFGVIEKALEVKKDESITAGKAAFLAGKTEEEITATGDRYTKQGYLTLQAKDKVNTWYATEAVAIEEAGKTMDPAAYQKFIGDKRASILEGITDPAAKKVAVAAFEETSPRLAQSQLAKNNEHNKVQRVRSFEDSLRSGSQTAADAPTKAGGSIIPISSVPLAPVVQGNDVDREIGIRTLLGEAGNQGADGMAAVAHVLRNRATDGAGRYGKSISEVAKQEKQFSVWNNGATAASTVKPGSPEWEKAGAVYDAVMSGRSVDMTGGATHYYSPQGMKAQREAALAGAPKPTIAATAEVGAGRGLSIKTENGWALVPTVDDKGKALSDDEALKQFEASGKHLGVFSSDQDAIKYNKVMQKSDKPDWFDDEANKAGGSIKIGGHVFAGKPGKGFSGIGELKFRDPSQDKLAPNFRSILNDTSASMGRPLVIASGHRDQDHSAERGKASPGEHTKGTSSDVDMSGMNDKERADLVRNLRSRGVLRFGTYSNMPNVLHVDLKDQQNDGTSWFMHDRTNAKMGNAPAWFKAAAAEDPAKISAAPTTAQPDNKAATVQSGTMNANYIRGINLPPEQKAKSVADTMRRQFDEGSDALYQQVGGVAMLYELKAAPADIDEVIKARTRFEQKNMNKFSAEQESWKSDILSRAERGENIDTILGDIDKRTKMKLMDDSHARALASEAASKSRDFITKGGKSVLQNPDYLNEVGAIYQRISSGTLDFANAAKETDALAKKYGANVEDTKSLTARIFALDQDYKDKLRTKAEALHGQKVQQDITKGEVDRSLAKGYGLEQVSGEKITVPNEAGQPTKVSAQEYGVQMIKDKWAKTYIDQVNAGKMDKGIAKPELTRKVFLELQGHDVVDTKTQAQMTGALTGNILDKDGQLKKSAVEAYETFLTWKQTQNVMPGYLARQIGNSEVQGLLETAYELDSGDLSKEQALIKAHEILKDPNRNPEDTLKKDTVWRSKMATDVQKALKEKVQPGFWEGLIYNDSAPDVDSVIKQQPMAENYVIRRAELYHMQNPNESANVSLEKAVADLTNNSKVVAGNLVISKPGFEIDKAMGVQGFGPKAADTAMNEFLRSSGPTLWPQHYDNPVLGLTGKGKGESYAGAVARGLATAIGNVGGDGERPSLLPSVKPRDVPVSIKYNAELGTVTVDLYADQKTGKLLGSPKVFRVRDIGAAYEKSQTTPGTISKMWNGIFEKTMGKSSPQPTINPQQ